MFFFFSFGGCPEAPLLFYIHIYNFSSNLAHLNNEPDITMVYSLHGCVQIFIYLFYLFIYLFILRRVAKLDTIYNIYISCSLFFV